MKRKKLILGVAAIFIVNICLILWFQAAPKGIAASVYKEGSRGDMVAQIQKVLKNEGLYTGNIDGIYGSNTAKAVRAYQQKYALTVDGIVGEKTLAKMGLAQNDGAQSGDVSLLARIISAEARGEPYEGQVAVGAVILNRIKHPSFPNTLAGVIYQPGAFSAINDGQFNEPVADISRRAAQDALNGVNPIGEAIYYYNPKTATNQWIRSRPIIKTIGAHVFCT